MTEEQPSAIQPPPLTPAEAGASSAVDGLAQFQDRRAEPLDDPVEQEKRLYRAIKAIADLPEGRIVLCWLMELGNFGATTYHDNPQRAAFLAGKQDPINRLLRIVTCPMDTLIERLEAAQREETRRQRTADPLWGGKAQTGDSFWQQ